MSTETTTVPATPQVAVNDVGTEEDFLAAIDKTIKYFNDGDIVEGTIVKVDRDEVLLDIGYKTEGVIPSRELSIKHDVDPAEVVSVGDHIEALVLTKEDKEGRLKGVLGILHVPQHAQAQPPDHGAMPAHQGREGPLVAGGDEARQQLPVARTALGRRTEHALQVAQHLVQAGGHVGALPSTL